MIAILWLLVFPGLSKLDGAYLPHTNTELGSQVAPRSLPPEFSDVVGLRLREFGVPVVFTPGLPPLGNTVGAVISPRAQKQVTRPHTFPVVAPVKNAQIIRNPVSIDELPRTAISTEGPTSMRELSVTFSGQPSGPFPASASDENLAPKSFLRTSVGPTAPTLRHVATSSSDYESWVKSGLVHLRVYDLSRIHGPLKCYVRADVPPAGGDCPVGPAPIFTVKPEWIFQKWPPGAKTVEFTFSTALIGGMREFAFTATTVTADSEYCLIQGFCPHK